MVLPACSFSLVHCLPLYLIIVVYFPRLIVKYVVIGKLLLMILLMMLLPTLPLGLMLVMMLVLLLLIGRLEVIGSSPPC